MRQFLDTNDLWTEPNNVDLSISAFMEKIAKQVNEWTGLSVGDILNALKHSSTFDGETRKWVKYTMGTLHIPGTP